MTSGLQGKKVAILATDGVEQSELLEPRKALDAAGAVTVLVSLKEGEIQAVQHDENGQRVPVDLTIDKANASEFAALVLPGGVANPDKLRTNAKAVQFVREFMANDKPVAAICHGPWTLLEAGVLPGRRITSFPSLRTDLRNAGAQVVDEQVVVDEGLVSSRSPDDLPAFCEKIVEEFAEGRHAGRMERTAS
jgi:protease I